MDGRVHKKIRTLKTGGLDPAQAYEIHGLLVHSMDSFSWNKVEFLSASCSGVHYIRTKTEGPIKIPHRRMCAKEQRIVRQPIGDALDSRVIRPLRSPREFTVILVPKPNGLVAFCVDHRKVNINTEGYAYVNPRTADALAALCRA